jgi:hypothetical protein
LGGVLTALGFSAILMGADQRGEIRGRAVTRYGEALPNVTVTAFRIGTHQAAAISETEPGGDFEFRGLPVGTYRITAVLRDWVMQETRPITLRAGAREEITFVLWPQCVDMLNCGDPILDPISSSTAIADISRLPPLRLRRSLLQFVQAMAP